MYILWPSKVQDLDGKPCQGIGGKIGKVTLTLMDKVFPLLSPQVMVTVWFHSMLLLLVGPLVRPTLEGSSTIKQHFDQCF